MTDKVDIRKQVGIALQAPSAFTSATIYPVNRLALLDMENELQLKAYSSNTAKGYLAKFSPLFIILKHHPVNEQQLYGQYAIGSVQAVFKNDMRLAKINKPVGIYPLIQPIRLIRY